MKFMFRESVTWNKIVTGNATFRFKPAGNMFDVGGLSMFADDSDILFYLLALCNSVYVKKVLEILSPTLNCETGHVSSIPVMFGEKKDEIIELSKECVKLSKQDWDAHESSWDFVKHPFLMPGKKYSLISDCNNEWSNICRNRVEELRNAEELINSLIVSEYKLGDELDTSVNDDEVTLYGFSLERDVKSFISYAVGCMFGRYSLDVEGLAYAGGEWDASKYTSFMPDEDNVIPITDEEYLEDDIVNRLCDWLKVVYGEDTLEENLDFIAKALENKGDTSRTVIRNYFLTDFFKDHCQTYSVTGSGKRPIYWLFDSGKQNGFKALVYLHRYNADTIGNLRVEYLHKMQRVYESEINRMQDTIDHSTNSREVATATKRKEKLTKQLKECRDYDEKIGHLALERIELDLDDGVKYNYRKVQTGSDGKFYEVLADSKAIMMDLKKYTDFKK